ncbi:DUF262 domain-containing protein [Streptomyces sp. NPDC006654]|uniref:DUF262 domain-containing protein n=1 Tax=Streptomyces sp. NPDC006654 TaxID=3156897 RepID=UPI00340506E6
MRADTVDLRRIFGRDIRYTVPLFQRPYVWDRDRNWDALWEDIRRAAERLERNRAQGGDGNVGPHFLGAVVFDEAHQPSSGLETREVIDGQQRLTTLQIFLLAARQNAAEAGDERSARLLTKFLENDEDLFDSRRQPEHRYKVWPTNADRELFRAVMEGGQGGTGRLAEAATFFRDEIGKWMAEAADPQERLNTLVQTLREQLRLVVIDLEEHDDAQVVFETLNSRGTPLEHADLVKNLLFRDAEHAGADVDDLYRVYWSPFDQSEWRTEQRTGRLLRSRLDVFLTHWLTMRTRREFPSSALFKEFEKWLRSDGAPTEATFSELAKYAEIYDEIERHPADGFEGRFLYRMKVMDTATPMPLLLFLYGLEEQTLSVKRRIRAVRAIDSYLVRRATLNLSNRDYNNVFRELVEAASHRPQQADEAVIEALAAMTGQHRFWPSDADFRAFLEREPIYTYLYRRQVRILLEALEDALRTDHTEQLVVPNGDHLGAKLTIEHIMPQSWEENWPLPNDASEADIDRDVVVHTLGNLTLATARLNPTIGNMGWEKKRSWLGQHSLLRLTHGTVLNAPPSSSDPQWGADWEPRRIQERGHYLASLALEIWPSPDRLLSVLSAGEQGD